MNQLTGHRIGDFIEIFDFVDRISLLTNMHIGMKTDGRKMIGFPKHAVPRYTNILKNAGFELVINEPKKDI